MTNLLYAQWYGQSLNAISVASFAQNVVIQRVTSSSLGLRRKL